MRAQSHALVGVAEVVDNDKEVRDPEDSKNSEEALLISLTILRCGIQEWRMGQCRTIDPSMRKGYNRPVVFN